MSVSSANFLSIFGEEETEAIGDLQDSDYSDAEPVESFDDESEAESDQNNEEDSDPDNFYLGKNKSTKWSKSPPPRAKAAPQNIFTERPGVKGSAVDCSSPLDCWNLFFPTALLEKIVLCTNQKLQIFRPNYKRERDCQDTNIHEIRALFGLLYLTAMLKMNHTNVSDMWATDGTAPDYIRNVMRSNRFLLLLRALRFDDSEDRDERKKIDKLAPIREVWEEITKRFSEFYCFSEYVTIDEMMFGFRGRCSFKQYMPNKPDRYGLKAFAVVDAHTFYTPHLELYAGKQPKGSFFAENKPAAIVK